MSPRTHRSVRLQRKMSVSNSWTTHARDVECFCSEREGLGGVSGPPLVINIFVSALTPSGPPTPTGPLGDLTDPPLSPPVTSEGPPPPQPTHDFVFLLKPQGHVFRGYSCAVSLSVQDRAGHPTRSRPKNWQFRLPWWSGKLTTRGLVPRPRIVLFKSKGR